MANRTNKQNRTFSKSCSVCSSSAPHRTEPNSTLVRFVFVRVSNIEPLVRFCSNRTRTEQYPCSVRVRQVRIIQSKVEDSVFLDVGLIPGLGSHIINNGRGSSGEQWPEEQWPKKFHKYSDIAASRIIKTSVVSA